MNFRLSRYAWPPRLATSSTLIRRCVALRRLYRHVAEASEPGTRVVLDDNVRVLDQLIADLRLQAGVEGGSSPHSGWRGLEYRHATDWLLRTVARREGDWLALLASRESALLRSFERAIAMAPAELQDVLRGQLPRLYAMHLDMDTLAGTAHH